jgi:hypothetical protein
VKINLRSPLLFVSLGLTAFFAGCATQSNSVGNTIPQARPAGWEGSIPGMGGFTGNTNNPTGGNGLR